jgi:hypothetical protein
MLVHNEFDRQMRRDSFFEAVFVAGAVAGRGAGGGPVENDISQSVYWSKEGKILMMKGKQMQVFLRVLPSPAEHGFLRYKAS